jgi:hypothetical protein
VKRNKAWIAAAVALLCLGGAVLAGFMTAMDGSTTAPSAVSVNDEPCCREENSSPAPQGPAKTAPPTVSAKTAYDAAAEPADEIPRGDLNAPAKPPVLDRTSPQEIFEKRIMPIFRSPNPSSCVQCHLADVDLKNYIHPSHKKTFVSLRDQGLVNLDNPSESKILKLIKMGEGDRQGATLITEQVRKLEFEAFAEWIKASCADPQLRSAARLAAADLARPAKPDEVIRHGRTDRLLESFVQNVWAYRERCLSCHMQGGNAFAKHAAKHGEKVMGWMNREGAEATMRYLMSSELLDTAKPERSLLLTKPTVDGVTHGGGRKMIAHDLAYKGFRLWLEDYAAVVKGKYTQVADLPPPGNAPLAFDAHQIALGIDNTPPAWSAHLVQVTVHAWNMQTKSWEAEPIAMGKSPVWPKRPIWQQHLTLLAAKGSDRARTWEKAKPILEPGRYLIKVHVDFQDRLKGDFRAELGAADFVGQAEIDTPWKPGGGASVTRLEASQLRR